MKLDIKIASETVITILGVAASLFFVFPWFEQTLGEFSIVTLFDLEIKLIFSMVVFILSLTMLGNLLER